MVSFRFSVALVKRHSAGTTSLYVAGAIYSGFAMVLNLMIPIRRIYGLQNLITERTLNNMACVMLAVGWMVIYNTSAWRLSWRGTAEMSSNAP